MYEPQEDSIMLKDVVEKFLSNHNKNNNSKCITCLDMGTGTGIQGIALGKYCSKVVCTDINDEAVNFVSNILKDKKFLILKSDLFQNLQDFKKKFDLITFNPPYLPREEDEEDDIELTSSKSGIDITSKFIIQSKDFLTNNGKLFFVASSLADLNSLNELLKKEGFDFKIAKMQHFFFEDIIIYEAWLA